VLDSSGTDFEAYLVFEGLVELGDNVGFELINGFFGELVITHEDLALVLYLCLLVLLLFLGNTGCFWLG